jgi:hypothetical protein
MPYFSYCLEIYKKVLKKDTKYGVRLRLETATSTIPDRSVAV